MAETRNKTQAIIVRPPESIYQAHGDIENGHFDGRWHFAFDEYYNRDFTNFGTLRVFNDDTLSPGAVWPLHPHRNIEVVTYCVSGEFRHADQNGKGNVLEPGWVQHTTVGRGMWHSEINNRPDVPMRFIQMWFVPQEPDLEPALQQKVVELAQRTDVLLPLVDNNEPGALPIAADAAVYSSFLRAGNRLTIDLAVGRGAYIYVTGGGPLQADKHVIEALGAAKIIGGLEVTVEAQNDTELLLVRVPLTVGNRIR